MGVGFGALFEGAFLEVGGVFKIEVELFIQATFLD